jgi:hypothetical protein
MPMLRPQNSLPVVIFFLAAALGGCALGPSPGEGPAAESPVLRAGDRWVYQGEDGFRVKTTWEETHEVTSIGADGIAVRIALKGPSTDLTRSERWSAPGLVTVGSLCGNETRRFAVPLQRLAFPLAPGKVCNQRVDNFNEATQAEGNVNHWVRVAGWTKVTTPAGTFDALQMQVLMRLDDDTFWRFATECNYAVWYAPAARAIVRVETRAQYREKGGGVEAGGAGVVRTQFGTLELVSFPAAP